jgi:hypothetical protein
MKLLFHHFFVFCSPGGVEAEALVSAGFLEGSRNNHPGQGTANRRFFFSNGMLEFLWVENPDEIQNSVTKPTFLYERSRSFQTGFSPFGIGTYGKPANAASQPFPGWSYQPAYLPSYLEIWVANNGSSPEEPMLFYGSFFPDPSRNSNLEPTAHKNSVTRLSKLVIEMAGKNQKRSPALDLFNQIDLLEFREGPQALATITFDEGKQHQELDLRPSVPLVLKY